MELEEIEEGTQLSLIDKEPDRVPLATKDTKDKVYEILSNQENSVVDKFLELDKLIESDSHIIYLKLTDIKANHKKSHNYLGKDEYKTQFKQKKLSEIEKKVESVRRLKFKIIALGFLTNNKDSKIVVEKDVNSLLYKMFEKGLGTQTLIIEKQKEILTFIEREESLFSVLEAKDKITDELKSTQALIIIDQNGLKRKKDSLYKKNKSIISEKIKKLGNYITHITSILSNENITKIQQQEVNDAQEFIVKSQKEIFNEIEELLLKNSTDFIISEIVDDIISGNQIK
ncbi:MAG: hypothetical protein PHN31_00695 [Candidatus Gracilibacteria bacterium]|nr:hypothetical protein [Candidatus Gracilibacteria bacterium]